MAQTAPGLRRGSIRDAERSDSTLSKISAASVDITTSNQRRRFTSLNEELRLAQVEDSHGGIVHPFSANSHGLVGDRLDPHFGFAARETGGERLCRGSSEGDRLYALAVRPSDGV